MDLAKLHTIEDMRLRARRRLPKIVFDFIEGGAGDEITVGLNRRAFADIGLEPRYLRDVSAVDISTTVLGTEVSTPVLLAPTGLQRLAHREGELGVARAAGDADAVYVLSTASSYTIEEIAAQATGPLWFQLYLWRDRGVIESLVERARAAGCRALCLTVDTPVVAQRDRDMRNGMKVPPRIGARNALDAARRLRWLYGLARGDEMTFVNLRQEGEALGSRELALIAFVNQKLVNPGATWADLRWLRELWDGPLAVKGITHVEDAQRAVEEGADGIVVSNHGGRQIDGAPATVERLPWIVDAVGDRAEVLVDGGVRRGSDVVKALSLGARACLVGRPYWYGLGAAGGAGVRRCLEILDNETRAVMALLGRPTIGDLDVSAVRVPESWKLPVSVWRQ
jgi:L-lactate dehydrogenase (cytochrome)